MTLSLGLLLICILALSCFTAIVSNSMIAQPTASQLTTVKESSIMLLLNNVKRYLPDASIVVGIITPNGYRNCFLPYPYNGFGIMPRRVVINVHAFVVP